MKTAIFIIVLLLSANLAFAQKSKVPGYKIRASKGAVTVIFQKKAHRLNVTEKIDAEKITETELMFAGEKDGFRYLVVDVTGNSRDSDFDRECGAGVESNLIWLKLNATWKIVDVKAVRYQSCWSGADLNEPFKMTKNTLFVDYDDIRPRLNVKLSYNADEPEKGFQIEEKPLKDR